MVEQGDVVRITRDGRIVARLVPEGDRHEGDRRPDAGMVIERIKALQARTGSVSVEELLSAKHEGHRF